MHAARVRLALVVATFVLVNADTHAQTPQARAAHVLNRLTFGPRPGEVDRVVALGIDRWIDAQLNPETINDTAKANALNGCQLWTLPLEEARELILRSPGFRLITRDSARKLRGGSAVLADNQLIGCRLARMESSDQQLLEVMTNFWENHFSVYGRTMLSRIAVVEWDRAVLRPHALGRFRDLLGAVAHSPTMLHYLDNALSRASTDRPTLPGTVQPPPDLTPDVPILTSTGLNENYARELLELHTLGVDGGYTQTDVIEVARALTGWTHTRAAYPAFVAAMRVKGSSSLRIVSSADARFAFDSTWHDAGEKTVLGHTLPAGRGLEDGEQVLDILARHPATARFIARKLAVRFVSDSPPESLVERAAETFLRTDGDIRSVVRSIVTSPEFMAPAAYGAKIKSPLELVLSTRRALAAPVDTAAEAVDLLINLKQTPFGYLTPDGWPETGDGWMNAGALIQRMSLATSIGYSELPSIPLEAWPAWKTLSAQSFEQQVDEVIGTLLHGRAAPQLRAAFLASAPVGSQANTPEARERALRRLIALALGSPEFQRR